MLNNPDYYKNITINYPSIIPSPWAREIELDINRTFPDEPEFPVHKIRNVLLAFSRRNQTIGYCQGFNFIVGTLLKVYKNEV
jgi:hypothetical protein